MLTPERIINIPAKDSVISDISAIRGGYMVVIAESWQDPNTMYAINIKML